MVQFFGDEQSLGETVLRFVGSGLVEGEVVLVVERTCRSGED